MNLGKSKWIFFNNSKLPVIFRKKFAFWCTLINDLVAELQNCKRETCNFRNFRSGHKEIRSNNQE